MTSNVPASERTVNLPIRPSVGTGSSTVNFPPCVTSAGRSEASGSGGRRLGAGVDGAARGAGVGRPVRRAVAARGGDHRQDHDRQARPHRHADAVARPRNSDNRSTSPPGSCYFGADRAPDRRFAAGVPHPSRPRPSGRGARRRAGRRRQHQLGAPGAGAGARHVVDRQAGAPGTRTVPAVPRQHRAHPLRGAVVRDRAAGRSRAGVSPSARPRRRRARPRAGGPGRCGASRPRAFAWGGRRRRAGGDRTAARRRPRRDDRRHVRRALPERRDAATARRARLRPPVSSERLPTLAAPARMRRRDPARRDAGRARRCCLDALPRAARRAAPWRRAGRQRAPGARWSQAPRCRDRARGRPGVRRRYAGGARAAGGGRPRGRR